MVQWYFLKLNGLKSKSTVRIYCIVEAKLACLFFGIIWTGGAQKKYFSDFRIFFFIFFIIFPRSFKFGI